jgi:demethylmenaquinone methyltransferase/2-methoxy-6-polyprenyl-1,4-benzoquinol methylase
MTKTGDNYDRIAWLYDTLATVYSGGKIRALKLAQIDELKPSDRILYAGAGSGDDAVLAAQMGAAVTVLDISPRMLDQAARKARAAGLGASVEIICSDVLKHERLAYYDVVVANFFLNIFSEQDMLAVLARLAATLRPGGRLLIGDFSFPSGNFATRLIQRAYYSLSMFSFWLFGGTTLHPIYDYGLHLAPVGLTADHTEIFRVSRLLPVTFESTTAIKL